VVAGGGKATPCSIYISLEVNLQWIHRGATVKLNFIPPRGATQADLKVSAEVERAVAEVLAAFGTIDILIHNAGGDQGCYV
jgi:NAD(P)-dependent dehydrogenase (short-subunit alcohol dehydrogenase family)